MSKSYFEANFSGLAINIIATDWIRSTYDDSYAMILFNILKLIFHFLTFSMKKLKIESIRCWQVG